MLQVKMMRDFTGISIEMENSKLLIIKAEKGIIGCGFISIDAAEKFGEAVAVISGVSSIEEMLEKPVVKVSEKARELGIKEGMSGKEALEKMRHSL
ncbi:MAG: hypothetical protein PWR09_1073 [Archaeoglobi archaeon]|nr:YunC family protein [Candidatus Mnemosynella bozhongmuii]MDI3502947.1 hypothetical protein [Archaeoglobi archaeon]